MFVEMMKFIYVNIHVLEIPFLRKKNTGNIPWTCCRVVSKLHFFMIKDSGKFKSFEVELPPLFVQHSNLL